MTYIYLYFLRKISWLSHTCCSASTIALYNQQCWRQLTTVLVNFFTIYMCSNMIKCNRAFSFISFHYTFTHSHLYIFIHTCTYIYCYDHRGSCSWESMKSLLNNRRFINKRNFRNEQAPSVENLQWRCPHSAYYSRFHRKPNTGIISHVPLQITAVKHKSFISQT